MRRVRGKAAKGLRNALLTKVAGWTAVTFGAVHTVIAPLDARDGWSKVADDGWWNAFTLDKATTAAELERSETFWISLGSFGVPVLALGAYVVWSARQGHRVPGWLGWTLIAWAAPTAYVLPKSPIWTVLAIGALLVLGDRARERDATAPAAVTRQPASAARIASR